MRRLRVFKFWGVVFLGGAILVLAGQGGVRAQGSKRVDKLNFQLPEDWPVEKRGGLITPISTEEYVSMKFKKIDDEFQSVRDEFSERLTGFQLDLKGLKEDLSKEIKKNQSSGEDPSWKVTGAASGIESLKSEVARLNEEMTNSFKRTQAAIDQMKLQIEDLRKDLKALKTKAYKLDERVDYLQEDQLLSR